METYNSNEMMSLGEAETFEGENVSSPLAPPTTTLITFGTAEDGVGSGEPGYDEYVVVQVAEPAVMVSVTMEPVGSTAMVAVPYSAVVQPV